MKKNFNDLTELCRGILKFNLDGFAKKDAYSYILGEVSTHEFERRLSIITDFISNELEEDGTREEATRIKEGLSKKIKSRD